MNEEKDFKNEEEQKLNDGVKQEEKVTKTDDSFFFENQEEELKLEDYSNRESTGFAGVIQKIHSLLRGMIDKLEKMSMSTFILLVITGLLTFAIFMVQQRLNPTANENLSTAGIDPMIFGIIMAVATPLIQYIGLRIVFSFTKKEMTPIPTPKERNTRIGIYLVTTSIIGLLLSAIPIQIIASILGFIVGIITYAAVFYDRVEDEKLFSIGIKAGLIGIAVGIVIGLIVGIVVVGVVVAAIK